LDALDKRAAVAVFAGSAFGAAFVGVFNGLAAIDLVGFFTNGAGLGAAFTGDFAAGLALLGVATAGAVLAFAAAMGLVFTLLELALLAFTA
jgi:hypothetical protein